MSASLLSLHPLVGPISSLLLTTINFTSTNLFIPLLLPLAPRISAPLWAGVYHRGRQIVVPLATFSSIACFTSAYMLRSSSSSSTLKPSPLIDARSSLVVNGIMTLGNMAWTAAFMLGINARLCELADGGEKVLAKAGSGEVSDLIARWGWMNMVRAGITGVGAVVGFVGVYGGSRI